MLPNANGHECIYTSLIAKFFFQPDPIDGVKFEPIKIDKHKGVIKIVDEEIYYDFQLNTTQSIIVGRDRESFRENSKRI